MKFAVPVNPGAIDATPVVRLGPQGTDREAVAAKQFGPVTLTPSFPELMALTYRKGGLALMPARFLQLSGSHSWAHWSTFTSDTPVHAPDPFVERPDGGGVYRLLWCLNGRNEDVWDRPEAHRDCGSVASGNEGISAS